MVMTDLFKPASHYLKEPGAWVNMIDDGGTVIAGAYARRGVVETVSGVEMGEDDIMLNPGAGFELHTHEGCHFLRCLRGRGFVKIDGVDYELVPKSRIFVPANLPHAMRAAKNERLVVVAFGHDHRDAGGRNRMKVVRGN